MDKIKIVIVDDMIDIREYFEFIISREQDMDVVGMAATSQEALDVALQTKPDIVLMDMQLETKYAGIKAIENIKEVLPETKIIVITIHDEDEILFRAYSAGAIDFIAKTSSVVDIISSIRNVFLGSHTLRPAIADKLLAEFSRMRREQGSLLLMINKLSTLTNSEYSVLKAVYMGKTYDQIARERFVEDVTIRTLATRIIKKFDQRNMKDVVKLLRELKVFELLD